MNFRLSTARLLAVALGAVLVASVIGTGNPAQAIIGGEAAPDGAPSPAVVKVYGDHVTYYRVDPFHMNPQSHGAVTCTGTLIAPTWVLTAQHCTNLDTQQGRPFAPKDMSIRVAPGNGTKPRRVNVVSIERMAGYYETSGVQDVALLRLASPVDDVTPLPVLQGASVPRIWTIARYGWGQTEPGGRGSPVLKYSTETVYTWNQITGGALRRTGSGSDCGGSADPTPDDQSWTSDAALFTWASDGGGSGSGDSGGPVLFEVTPGQFAVVGVTQGTENLANCVDHDPDPRVVGQDFLGVSNRVDTGSRAYSAFLSQWIPDWTAVAIS